MIKDKNEFVSTIVTNSQGKVFYFIRRDDLKLDPGKKDFISGHIKEDEIPIHAMYREIKEETGILPEEIIKFLNLGEINLPHPLLKNKKCQLYCIMINHTIEQFQESINNKAKDKEFKEIQQLDSIEDLLKDIKEEFFSSFILYIENLNIIFFTKFFDYFINIYVFFIK